jgi:hypothetical protein
MADVAQQTRQVGMAPILPSERGLSFFDTLVLWADLGISSLVVAADRLGYLRGHYYGIMAQAAHTLSGRFFGGS